MATDSALHRARQSIPVIREATVTDTARMLRLFDALADLDETTASSLWSNSHPAAPGALRLWVGSREDAYYLEEYETAYGRCLAARRKTTHQSIIHIYVGSPRANGIEDTVVVDAEREVEAQLLREREQQEQDERDDEVRAEHEHAIENGGES